MNQPVFWASLLGIAITAGGVRALRGRPFLPRRSVRLGTVARTVAVLSTTLLVFHCAAMFFAPWVEAIGALRPLATEVTDMGVTSQVAYWVPAAALLLVWRRVWWPGLALVAVTLTGVGVTMYGSYPLSVHLSWLAAVIVSGVFVSTALTGLGTSARERANVPREAL